jgi:hypothetical protein
MQNDYIELEIKSQIENCRYCLEEDDEKNLISPCSCSGTTKYVHSECLIHWLNSKNEKRLNCEICKGAYAITEETDWSQLLFVISYEFFVITILQVLSYLIFGLLLVGSNIHFYKFSDYWTNIFMNGYILNSCVFASTFILYIIITPTFKYYKILLPIYLVFSFYVMTYEDAKFKNNGFKRYVIKTDR